MGRVLELCYFDVLTYYIISVIYLDSVIVCLSAYGNNNIKTES